jgi:hypothetical protein
VSVREKHCHLDYVAAAPCAAGSGLGTLLLRDAVAASEGLLSMDVFASNVAVRAWYERSGFVPRYERPVQVVELAKVAPLETTYPEVQPSLQEAREMEDARGFAEFEVKNGSVTYRFSLIGRSTVRLLDYPPGLARDAAATVATLVPDRPYLALPVGDQDGDLPSYFADQLIRMEYRP